MYIKNLLNIVHQFKGKKVMVIGDLMLDKYVFGEVSRISPEAPVPVVKAKEETYVPGGAANVANNITSLGGLPFLIGIVGDDSAKKTFFCELKKRGIRTSDIIINKKIPTIQKIRVIGHSQQLIRIDYEKNSADSEQLLIKNIKKRIRQADIIIVSDYAKGVVTKNLMSFLIKTAEGLNKKVFIDTKPQHFEFYKNAFLITPNHKEAEQFLQMKGFSHINGNSDETVEKMGIKIMELINCNVLITRGEKGMSLFEKGKNVIHIPTQAKEVYDVTGAGDTAIAVLSLALCTGATLDESAILANSAAGVVVGKVGTAALTTKELLDIFQKEETKIKSIEELKEIIKKLKYKNKIIVFTNGCFDILHVGHTQLLNQAKKLGDVLILGLNSDNSIRRLKGPSRPIMNERERAEVLSALESVDYIVFFNEDTPLDLIKIIKPNFLAKGADYTESNVVGSSFIKNYGGKTVLIPLVKGYSTTDIINKIKRKK